MCIGKGEGQTEHDREKLNRKGKRRKEAVREKLDAKTQQCQKMKPTLFMALVSNQEFSEAPAFMKKNCLSYLSSLFPSHSHILSYSLGEKNRPMAVRECPWSKSKEYIIKDNA